MKYYNKKVDNADGKFDSQLEYRRYCCLKIYERAGEIKDLKRQVKFVLINKSQYGREISYIADFTYIQGDKYIVEDTKSKATITPVYRLKKRLLAESKNIIIKEITKEDVENL